MIDKPHEVFLELDRPGEIADMQSPNSHVDGESEHGHVVPM